MTIVKRFLRDERGATSIEYALIGTLVSIAIVLGATAIGTKLNARFTPISGNLG